MKGYCGRCLEMRLTETPGYEVKWPWLMVVIKVDLTGLKADLGKYMAS